MNFKKLTKMQMAKTFYHIHYGSQWGSRIFTYHIYWWSLNK